MREIKFRGKRIDNGEWIYFDCFGNTLSDEPTTLGKEIKTEYEIDDETVGQYIGIKDINGKEIYEGDFERSGYIITYVDGSDGSNLGMNIGFYTQRDDFTSWCHMEFGERYEILGNIHDNPELMNETN